MPTFTLFYMKQSTMKDAPVSAKHQKSCHGALSAYSFSLTKSHMGS